MNRTLEIAADKLTAEQKTVFDQLVTGRGRILGPYKIWIHSPTVASGMEHIGTYLNKKGSLSEREVEIGILVIAQHWDADYVRQAHIKMGKLRIRISFRGDAAPTPDRTAARAPVRHRNERRRPFSTTPSVVTRRIGKSCQWNGQGWESSPR